MKIKCPTCSGVIPCVECSGGECPYCGEEIIIGDVREENQAV